MKVKFRNYFLAVSITLLIIACFLPLKFASKNVFAQAEGNSENNNVYCANSFETARDGFVASKDDLDNCLYYDYREDHGFGRENGGTGILQVGCRNYKGFYDGYTYGSTNIPYWINKSSFNKIANATNRECLINRIRVQTELWNQSYMYDGTGKFINFYEVVSDIKPSEINNRPVIEVVAYDFGDNAISGQFVKADCTVRIGYNFSGNTLLPGIQAVAHEFGHILGLSDLDTESNAMHGVLMGYYQTVTNETLNTMIHYQDIQGAAAINGVHICADSHFMRYKYLNGSYNHICFYCDRVYSSQNILSGSKVIMSTCNEDSHDYQPIVSCGNMRWEKCTKCYKVVEINVQAQCDYNVFLFSFGSNNINLNSINIEFGEYIPQLDQFAPKREGYAFDGYCDASGKKYYEMKVENDEQSALIYAVSTYYVEKPCPVSGVKWDHRVKVTLYPIWKPLECNFTYNNVTDGKILSTTTVPLRDGTNSLSPIVIEKYIFMYFEYGGKQYTTIPAEINIRLHRASNGNVCPQSKLTAYYKEDTCIAKGSLITLANGSQVAVEDLKGDEMLLVWNLHTGSYDVAPILFIDTDPEAAYEVINLSFSDKSVVKVIHEHGFWDYDLNKYVYFNQNADQYIGHWFNKGDKRVCLTGVEIREEITTPYSPITYGHLCYFVDGMLSMPGGIEGLFNIFEVDAETMKYDEAAMLLDIETYGLFSYDEFIEYLDVSEEVFEAFNGRYLKVAIGKGLIDMDQLSALAERYQQFL